MVDETSEQKQLKNRVAVVDKTCGPLIDGVLAVPMRKIRASGSCAASGAAMTSATTRPGKSENGKVPIW